MPLAFLKSLLRQLVMIVSIVLILVAVYVSVGRQFMPAIAGYKDWVEERLTTQFGTPVAIESLTGGFTRFNPVIQIEGLRFGVLQSDDVPEDETQGLEFARAQIELNIWQTILQRQIVLENFDVRGLELTARYTSDGSWILSGISLQQGGSLDIDAVYDTVQRVSMLALNDVSITLQLPGGGVARFNDIAGFIQNSASSHFIHIDASMGGSERESEGEGEGEGEVDGEGEGDIRLSLELTGDTLRDVDGTVHLSLPDYDYSGLTRNERFGDVTLGELAGGGEAWIVVADGQFVSAIAQPRLHRVGFSIGESPGLAFQAVSGDLRVTRDPAADRLEFVANDLTLDWNGRVWQSTDGYAQIDPDRSLSLRAEAIDVTAVREIILASGLAGQPLVEPLEAYVPRGILRNLSLQVPLGAGGGSFKLRSNLDDLAVDRVGGTPAMTGISGYLALDYDFNSMFLDGVAEVDTGNFTINIAGLFADTWQYDRVNGRVRFQFESGDRYLVKVASETLVAESEIVDGRARFSTTFERQPDGERISEFSLQVGALRMDGSKKSPYLPNAPGINPGLFRTMSWLDDALLDGSVYNSGVIFQGSLLRDQTRSRSSFLGFFNFDDGQVEYIDTWPALTDVSGAVVVDNGRAFIEVESGLSMGLTLGPTRAAIEEGDDGQSWLNIQGTAAGATRDGLEFLEVAPLEAVLGDLMTDWIADGNVAADVNLRVPLGEGADQPFVEIRANLDGNSLQLPRYSLTFEEVNGLIDFNTDEGLHDSALTASVFGGMAQIEPRTSRDEEGEFITSIAVRGDARTAILAEWPGQSSFVVDLLGRTEGDMSYRADLTVQGDETRLQINSDLRGVSLNLPAPFGKQATQSRPLNLNIINSNSGSAIDGVYGSDLSLRVQIDDGELDGIVYLGTMPGIANPWQSGSDSPGVEVRGNLDVFDVEAWLGVLSGTSAVESPTQGLTNSIAGVSLDVGVLDLYGQRLESVAVDILHLEDTDYWTVALDSQSIAGSILLPFDRGDYIEAYLAYLHLPGSDEPEEPPVEVVAVDPQAEPEERVDVLAALDPRDFPPVRFLAGEVTIGDRSYGLGQFSMDPGPDGVDFTDLIIDFRGFRVGRVEGDEPVFSWHYDGENHYSSLAGIIIADDMADVLRANGFAASMESSLARFDTRLDWSGSPAFFNAANLNGEVVLDIQDGRFLQDSGGPGALKLISIINLNAIMRRLRFSDDLLRRGLAFDEIRGDMILDNGLVTINDRLVISGPSSVFQVTGDVDLVSQTIDGHMYITLPVSDNIPWLGLLTGSLPLAIGAYLFDQIFGDQVNSLTSAQYRLEGPWDGLEPQFEQAFGAPPERAAGSRQPAGVGQNQ